MTGAGRRRVLRLWSWLSAAAVLVAATAGWWRAGMPPFGPGTQVTQQAAWHGCRTTPAKKGHMKRSTSDAWMAHGVSGTVVDITGHLIAIEAKGGTVATAYRTSERLRLAPGDTVRVRGALKSGLIMASSVRRTGGRPWSAKAPAPVVQADANAPKASGKIKHVIFIIQENHSFDNYFGAFPGVAGLPANASLPTTEGGSNTVAPFHIEGLLPGDLDHTWKVAHIAYDGGKMDGFIYADQSPNVMGYYTGADIPNYWAYAAQFALDDNFFASLLGPSLPNHLYAVAAQAGGWIWNMWQPPRCGFNFASLANVLSQKHIPWAYFSGEPPQKFWLWTPLPGFQSFMKSRALRGHLQRDTRYFKDLRNGTLPAMSWITPTMLDSEHPPTDEDIGMWYVTDLLNALMKSPDWKSTMVVITWDEYGGFYDSVKPAQVDRYGFGFRVPALVISPYVPKGKVDGTQFDFTSVLKFVEEQYGIAPLTSRDAAAHSVGTNLDLTQAPRVPFLVKGPVPAKDVPKADPPPGDRAAHAPFTGGPDGFWPS